MGHEALDESGSAESGVGQEANESYLVSIYPSADVGFPSEGRDPQLRQ